MPFAGTGFTPKREHGTCFLFIITMEFLQKEFDTINKNMNRKKCVLMKYDKFGIHTEIMRTHRKNAQQTPAAITPQF